MKLNSTLANNIKGNILLNKMLADYTSWRIGGPAKRYYRPKDIQDLSNFLQIIPEEEPLFWLGLGSNILIRDSGFPGTVIHTLHMSSTLRVIGKTIQDGIVIRAEAGTTCSRIAHFCAKNQLLGGEFLVGIPGTFGGALAMNAGSYGEETWRYVIAVETMNRHGEQFLRHPNEFHVGYREVIIPQDEWFIAGHLCFLSENNLLPREKICEVLKKRILSQPIGTLNCGSVFRNPPGRYAAELIEASQLKGKIIGKASISNKHTNFIINEGGALAKDVESLIDLIQEQIWKDHHVELVPEVHRIGVRKA